MRALILSLLLGALAAMGFAPLGWWPLALLCLAGWVGLLARAGSLRQALLRGWSFGYGQFVVGLNWIATAFTYQDAMPHWLGWIAVGLLSVYLAVFPALASGIAWRWGRGNMPALATMLAAGWIACEWLRATLFTGFAWNPLGAMLVEIGTAARYVGTYGLSAVMILSGGAIAALAARRWHAASLLSVPLAATALLAWSTPPAPQAGPGAPRLRVIQPNINQNEKWDPALAQRNYLRLAQLSGRPDGQARLLLWPEAAVPAYLGEEPDSRRALAGLLGPRDLLLTGATDLLRGRDGAVTGAHNSLFVLDAQGTVVGRYDKAHLVPYGEYLPMRPLLSKIGLSRLAPGDLDFAAGPGPRTLALPGVGAMGVQICYEMIFSGKVVDRSNRPAFLFNPSNDAWFGSWGPPQHLAQARMRAIEEGLPVVRSTPTGISALVDADGKVKAAIPWHEAGAFDAALPAALPPTPFARHGNLLAFALAAALTLIAIAARRISR